MKVRIGMFTPNEKVELYEENLLFINTILSRCDLSSEEINQLNIDKFNIEQILSVSEQ